MKQTWLLSCLGSLGKRKKNFEGKLNAMFSKEMSDSCHKKIKRETSVASPEKDQSVTTTTPPTGKCDKQQTIEKAVAREMSKPLADSDGRVRKKVKTRQRKNKKDVKNVGSWSGSLEEIYAKAKINSKGDMTANVGKKYV